MIRSVIQYFIQPKISILLYSSMWVVLLLHHKYDIDLIRLGLALFLFGLIKAPNTIVKEEEK